jgi:hypothetical protein
MLCRRCGEVISCDIVLGENWEDSLGGICDVVEAHCKVQTLSWADVERIIDRANSNGWRWGSRMTKKRREFAGWGARSLAAELGVLREMFDD